MELSTAVERSENSHRPVEVTYNGNVDTMLSVLRGLIDEDEDTITITPTRDGRFDVWCFCPEHGDKITCWRLTVTFVNEPVSRPFPLLSKFIESHGTYQQGRAVEVCIAADDLADVNERTIDRAARYLDLIERRHHQNVERLDAGLLGEIAELSERLTDTAG